MVDLFADGEDQGMRTIERTGERLLNPERALVSESNAEPLTVRFDELPAGDKDLELWLPTSANVELLGLRADAPICAADEGGQRWIHYGSSISHCAEALRPSQAWPAVAAQRAGVRLTNLGAGGNCHLDPFVARAIRDTSADCISLKIGINIVAGDTLTHRTFVPAIHGFLDTIRDGHPQTPILLISPIICPTLEASPGPLADEGVARAIACREGKNALSLTRVREILEEVVAIRSSRDARLHYLDGLKLFGAGDLDELPDGLHPSPAGYLRIGERFAGVAFAPGGAFASVAAAAAPAS